MRRFPLRRLQDCQCNLDVQRVLTLTRPMSFAPLDGTTILLPIMAHVPAYWDEELHTWVLARPFLMERIDHPSGWIPTLDENE